MSDYYAKLEEIPPPGSGCHPFLMGVCNAGVQENIPADQMLEEITAAIPPGSRTIGQQEIKDTIDKAFAEQGVIPQNRRAKRAPAAFKADKYAAHLVESAQAEQKVLIGEMAEMSKQRIPDEPGDQFTEWVCNCYAGDDLLFVGDDASPGVLDRTIKTVGEWAMSSPAGPKFIINPLDGEHKPTKSPGKMTFRGDANVKRFAYTLVEMDEMPLANQVRMWHTILKRKLLPVRSLTHSGGKSLHALVDISDHVHSHDDWHREVRERFFPTIMVPLGADKACRNPARLSRTPGFCEKGRKVQRLLYLG